MLRRIKGWVRIENETWEDTMHRMKQRVNKALLQWPIKDWSQRIRETQWIHASRIKISDQQSLPLLASHWNPSTTFDPTLITRPTRKRGRPMLRWDDTLNDFCLQKFGTTLKNAPTGNEWKEAKTEYLNA